MERSIGWFSKESMNDDERRHALAHELGVPFVELARDDVYPDALVLIPEPLSREHNIVAYKLHDDTLEVALLDLRELPHLDFLRPTYRLQPRLTSRESLTRALVRYQHHLRDTFGRSLERSDNPALLDHLLRHALHSRASSLHLQNDSNGLLVRYRINGSLKAAMTLPPAAGRNVIEKLRTLASLPAGTVPHSGRFRVDLGSGEDMAVGVSSVPIVTGEKLVLSIARERSRRGYTLESLGFHGEALEVLYKMLLRRRGLIRVLGNGKTTLLYTLLDLLNAPEHSLATIEERVGGTLPRVAQTEVSTSGLSAAAALRAALKTDADVVMIDTVADRETASIAQAAAARGTLVLAAVDDAELLQGADVSITTAVVRALGGKQFPAVHKLMRSSADALEGAADFAAVLAALKEEGRVEKDKQWKDLQFYKPVGSSDTPGGYQGLLGVQEVQFEGKPVGLNLIEDALFKAALGQTSIEEILKLL